MGAFKDLVKTFFNVGDFPTEEQFNQWFDSIWFKDELIPINVIEGLQETLNELSRPTEKLQVNDDAAPFLYTVPQGYYLETIILSPSLNCSPWCKYVGGDDIVPAIDGYLVTPAKGDVWDRKVLALTADVQIEVHGMPINSFIYFVKRKLPQY
jgi:hypothetical protein